MYQRTIFALLAGAVILFGQAAPERSSTLIFPPPAVAFDEVKKVLTLTDTQVDQLIKIMEQRSKDSEQQYKVIFDKQRELHSLIESGSTDALKVGQLTLEIRTLQKRVPAPPDQYRAQALAVLTADQKIKLLPLDNAIKISVPAYQAVSLNLIDPPPASPPVILSGREPVRVQP